MHRCLWQLCFLLNGVQLFLMYMFLLSFNNI